jgi:hypothetical protein
MNSKQRRKLRVYDIEVTIACGNDESYPDYARRLALAKSWLQIRNKQRQWIYGKEGFHSQTFKFRNGALATMFALKWS